MDAFKKGYDFFVQQSISYNGSYIGDNYITSINEAINKLNSDINSFENYQTSVKQLKGDIAEFWHADTFSINATINDSSNRATINRSHEFGSVDISTSFDKEYGLKYYSSAKGSAKAQAKSIFESYKEYTARGGKLNVEEYIQERGYSDPSVLNDPIYSGQNRLIPKDQLEEAADFLRRKIMEEESKRPELVKRYKETLDMLTDRIKDNRGNESISLSKADSEKIAELAKKGKFDSELYGVTSTELVKFSNILKKSFKAGLSSSTIALVLQNAPKIISAIEYLLECGEIDREQLKDIGFDAVKTAPAAFIQGTASAAIIQSCELGLAGLALKSLDPTIISTATVIVFNTIKNSYNVATGQISYSDMANNLVRDMFISTISCGLGLFTQAIIDIPVLGFMVGNFVGSIVGSFIYKSAYRPVISFCIDSGFTMFGLVEQDYKLPEEILNEIGIEVFEYEKYDYTHFQYKTFEYSKFNYDQFKPTVLEMTFLRRGVIGVSAVGYLT